MATSTNTPDHPFRVWINPDTLEKLNMYAAEAVLQKNSEIGGFARIHEEGQDVFVTDIFIPKQTANAGTFNITPEMDGEFMQEMIKSGRRKELPQWKSIVHSHPVGMGPSMSGTDVEAIQRRAEDTECYSLIISASRQADSTRMAMHYCCKIGGKTLIFRDMPVMVGWDIDRRTKADELVGLVAEDLGATTKSDLQVLQDAMRIALCELPPTFEAQRKELREQIKAEVKEKVSNGFKGNRTPWGFQGAQTPARQLGTALGGAQLAQNGRKKLDIKYTEQADLVKEWKNIQRLFSIGYDLIDETNPNPNAFVTKDQAKKARRLHKKAVIELNEQLRALGGVGMGDLVVATREAVLNNPSFVDLSEPTEVDDFEIQNGMISYEVGGEIMWSDELEVIAKYEDIMDWNQIEMDVVV